MKRILIFSAILLFFASCDRDLAFETITETDPELHVIVSNADGNKVSGATVSVFNSAENRDNDTNQLAASNTDSDGKAIFTEESLKEPGIFYVKVVSGELLVTSETPYILLNDGHTYFNVTVQ